MLGFLEGTAHDEAPCIRQKLSYGDATMLTTSTDDEPEAGPTVGPACRIARHFSASFDRPCCAAAESRIRETAWRQFISDSREIEAFQAALLEAETNDCVRLIDFRLRHFLVVRIDEFYDRWMAVIEIDDGLRDAAVRLGRVSLEAFRLKVRLHDQAEAIEGFAGQVTQDFEELTWLRGLSGRLNYCDASNSLDEVVRGVIPELRQIVAARSLAFVVAAPTPSITACDGDAATMHRLWQRFISVAEEHGVDQSAPLVQNAPNGDAAGLLNEKTIRSYVIVAVAHENLKIGWLIALNRQPRSELGDQLIYNGDAFSEHEFGTVEASLLCSAATMIATHAHNATLFREKEELLVGVIRALINAIDAKDAYTCGHSDRVALIAKRLAQALRLDAMRCERIYMAGLLHDIGKIGVPDEVLLKPGKLTDDEFALIKNHPTIGHSIMKHVVQLQYVLPGVLHHHEAINGRGYPFGLKGDEIPLEARILAVADAYDAMTSSRPYRAAMPLEKAAKILREGAGSQWDADVIDALFAVWDEMRQIGIESPAHVKSLLDDQEREDHAPADTADSIRNAVVAVR